MTTSSSIRRRSASPRTSATGTRVWAFAHVLPGRRHRRATATSATTYSSRTTSWSAIASRSSAACSSGTASRLEDDVFVGPNATFTNDRVSAQPAATRRSSRGRSSQRGASIGANATILPGLTIGRDAMVGAGAVVTRIVPPLTRSSSATRRASSATWTRSRTPASVPPTSGAELPGAARSITRAPASTLHRMPLVEDMRGNLIAGEVRADAPVRAAALLPRLRRAECRGPRRARAPRAATSFSSAFRGIVSVVVDDGRAPRGVPARHARARPASAADGLGDAVQLLRRRACCWCLLPHRYDPADYIRDYDEFLAIVRNR